MIHRDLKLTNLLLNDAQEVKVCDFGLACRLGFERQRKFTMCGTPNYIAPEVISGKVGHSYEADVWAIGVLLYTLLVGSPPFDSDEVKSIYRNIRYVNYSFPSHIGISYEAKSLIKDILVTNPHDRPSLFDILDHPFLRRTTSIKKSPFNADKKSKFRLNSTSYVKRWVESQYGLGYLLANLFFLYSLTEYYEPSSYD